MSNIDKRALREAAEKATPGRVGDRIDGSGSIKYECRGYDDSLVLRTDHKNMEYGFVGDNANADELFFRLCVPDVVLALLDELEAAEKRIAELKKFISQSCYVFDGRDADISDAYIDASTSGLMPKVGDSNEVKPCSYCSDGSYSGLPGGACEHCMGTGLDNPAAGIGKGE